MVVGGQFVGDWSSLHIIAVVPVVLSAIVAVIAIRPGKVIEVDPEAIRTKNKLRPPLEVEFAVYRTKLKSLVSLRERLKTRERLLIFSTWSFVIGLGLAGIEAYLLTTTGAGVLGPLPIETTPATITP